MKNLIIKLVGLVGLSLFAVLPALAAEVNIYSHRHYDVDKQLFKEFTKETGIKVNVIKDNGEKLIKRIEEEGKNTRADLFITADVGLLHLAKTKGILTPVKSKYLNKVIPAFYRDKDWQWVGLTKRARVIVYSKKNVTAEDLKYLKTYQDLTAPRWKGQVLVRSGTNPYNKSLLADLISRYGETAATNWAKGVVDNFARNPKGSDRDQARAVVAGVGKVAIINTYYLGLLKYSSKKTDQLVADSLGVVFPNTDTDGTHVNLSGVGIVKWSKNKANAVKLIEFLASEKAQEVYSKTNYEYPVREGVKLAPYLESLGTYNADKVSFNTIGENNKKAVEIFNKVGWK